MACFQRSPTYPYLHDTGVLGQILTSSISRCNTLVEKYTRVRRFLGYWVIMTEPLLQKRSKQNKYFIAPVRILPQLLCINMQ